MLNRSKPSFKEYESNYELGGNYFELIEFSLIRNLPGGRQLRGSYGVNVVKVREVVHMPKINPLSSSVPGIAGIFELRGVPIPAVNLCTVLGDYQSPVTPDQQIIVTEFSQKRAGFIVHATNRIRRVTWDKVLPPSADVNSSITGMMLIENSEFLFVLDLEKIIIQLESLARGNLNPDSFSGLHTEQHGGSHAVQANRNAPNILLVDDSNLILSNISRALTHEGYRVTIARNGLEALQRLEATRVKHNPAPSIHAIITDVEMPQMDGITLIKKIRAKLEFDKVPIFMHTSLEDASTREMGDKAGSNGHFVKNDVVSIIETLKRHFLTSKLSA